MYTFKKEHIEEDKNTLPDGTYVGTVVDIDDGMSKKGDRMFKVSWKVAEQGKEHTLYDFILPEHSNDVVRRIASQKLSTMAEVLLDAKDGEDVNIMDCIYKDADLVVKNEESQDGKIYPRIVKIKKNNKGMQSFTGHVKQQKPEKIQTVLPDDDIPF